MAMCGVGKTINCMCSASWFMLHTWMGVMPTASEPALPPLHPEAHHLRISWHGYAAPVFRRCSWSCKCNGAVQIWDLGGQQNLRPFWATYYKHTDAVIMVVDSTDRARVGVTKVRIYAA